MKKLVSQSVTDVNEIETKNVESVEEEKENDDVPPKTVYNYSLKRLKSYKNIRKACKMKNMKKVFVDDLKSVLKEFKVKDNELNDELLVEIMNIAEQYFFYPKTKEEREQLKSEVVFELMLPYFRNDIKLLEKTIGHVAHKVKKSKLYQRLFSRFKYFFLKHS